MDDIPGQPHEVFGPWIAFGEDGWDVTKRLTNLRDETVRQVTLAVPADDAAGHDNAAVGGHAVGVALRRGPAAWLKYLRGSRGVIFRTGQHRKRGPFWRAHEQLSIVRCLFRGDAGRRRAGLGHLPQRKALQFSGFRLWQLRDEFDRTRIFVGRDLALDMILQGS